MMKDKMNSRCSMRLAVLHILMVISVTNGCTFPKFVTRRSMWIATYDNEASLRSKITKDTIESSYCTNNGLVCAESIRKCNETREHDKFIVEHTEKTQLLAETEYLCIQFLRQSDDVIQIKTSTKMSVKSPSMCDNLNLDHWPMTSPSFQTAPPIKCPFSGGFNMQIRKSGKQLCAKKIPRARMESECGSETGIMFDFKHEKCIHNNLKMNLIQHVDCMAEWTTGNEKFVILRPDSDDFQPYCLRITSHSYDVITAYLFMDFVCDPGNSFGIPSKTVNYLSITFKKHIINSLCEDEFQECAESKFCESDMEEHCKKSCNHCRPEANICAIPEHIKGYWGILHTNISNFVNVSTYEFYQKDMGKMQCLKSNYTDKNHIILLQMFDNGCYPKFSCMEVFQSSPSIRQIRFGKRITWPVFPLSNVGKLACAENQFLTNIVVGKSKESVEIQNTTLIDPRIHTGVDCGLSEELGNDIYSLYFQEGAKCDGCVTFDAKHDKTVFTISTIDCSTAEKEIIYLCLASFKLNTNSTTAIITKRKSDVSEFLCWVFTRSGAIRKLLVLNVSDCNELSIRLVFEGDLKPKASFDIIDSPPKTCPKRESISIYKTVSKSQRNAGEDVIYFVSDTIRSGAPSYRQNLVSIIIMLTCVVYMQFSV